MSTKICAVDLGKSQITVAELIKVLKKLPQYSIVLIDHEYEDGEIELRDFSIEQGDTYPEDKFGSVLFKAH